MGSNPISRPTTGHSLAALVFGELSAQLFKNHARLFDSAVGFLELRAGETL